MDSNSQDEQAPLTKPRKGRKSKEQEIVEHEQIDINEVGEQIELKNLKK